MIAMAEAPEPEGITRTQVPVLASCPSNVTESFTSLLQIGLTESSSLTVSRVAAFFLGSRNLRVAFPVIAPLALR